jgi:excinuclease ABC subunit C
MNDVNIEIKINVEDISLRDRLDSLPKKPGVYQFRNADGKVIYIGKAKNLRSRVRSYFQRSRVGDAKFEALVSKISNLEIIVTDSEVEALILEANLVKRFRPRYNILLKDDKSYPYIVITNEPFPRVFPTRTIRRDGSKYFGPFTEVKVMKYALKTIRDTFMVRSCNYHIDEEVISRKKIKVCLDYHIKKCEGPCEGLVSQEDYNKMIGQVAQLLRGKTRDLVRQLEEEMNALSGQMRFEEAATVRNRLQALDIYSSKQKVVTTDLVDRDILAVVAEGDVACGIVFKIRDGKVVGRQHFYMSGVEGKLESEILGTLVQRYYLDADYVPRELFLSSEIEDVASVRTWLTSEHQAKIEITVPKIGDKAKLVEMCRTNARFLLEELKLQRLKKDFVPRSVESLQGDLHLSKLPRRIECFDISNIQGADIVASMISFLDGKPRKSEYRKFRIQSVEGPDDFASVREVMRRRYSRVLEEGRSMPDLIVVDGGKGQLSSAVGVLEELGMKDQPIIGLAKRLEEVFLPGLSDAQSIPKTSPGLRLLQRVRDEAHRFAVTYHRSLREKRTFESELDEIKGIGKKRAKLLLEKFGSVKRLQHATLEELTSVVGTKTGERLLAHFELEKS